MRHIISILVENEAGELSRISGLFSARGYNIDSLTVAPTYDPSLSRLTMATHGSEDIIEQIVKQLHKLICVVKLSVLTDHAYIERELMLVKIATTGEMRSEVPRLAEIFRGRIVDVTPRSFVVELVGCSEKLDAFLEAVGTRHLLEIARTGVTGMSRGETRLSL